MGLLMILKAGFQKCLYYDRSVKTMKRNTDGVIQKVLKYQWGVMILKAWFQKCQYFGRPVTKSERHTDGIIQNTSMAGTKDTFGNHKIHN